MRQQRSVERREEKGSVHGDVTYEDLKSDVFQDIVGHSKYGYEIIDQAGMIVYSNRGAERIGEYSSWEMMDKRLHDFFSPAAQQKIDEMIARLASDAQQRVTAILPFITKGGCDRSLEVEMSCLDTTNFRKNYLVSFTDITEQVKLEEAMHFNLHYDPLTKCKKRECFLETLKAVQEQAAKANETSALLLIDLSAIKALHFPLGDHVDEKLLVKVVQRLKTLFKHDDYIARYSEDVIAVIAEGCQSQQAYEKVAQEVLALFAKPFQVEAYEFTVHINMGIVVFPETEEEELTLQDQATIALNRSKLQGSNNYKFYSKELNIKYYKEFMLRNDICQAIQQRQLELYYQPIVDLKSSAIVGVETLMRWNHPQWGLISSDEFLAIAEETGLIMAIGKWVIDEVCHNYRSWQRHGYPDIKVHINVSGIQFLEEGFVRGTLATIARYRLKPDFLMMEISESVLVKDNEQIKADLDYLRSEGVGIVIDDFGSGYSSITCLQQLNVDMIKLNRSLTGKVPTVNTANIILQATIDLARELKIAVVAGGLEKGGQLTYLKELNCLYGQGYIYSRPQPRADFEAALRTGRCRPKALASEQGARVNNREFFRVPFEQYLEAELTILELAGRTVDIGNTHALVKDIGPGGLAFVANVKFPLRKDMILKFRTELVGEKLELYGSPVWVECGVGEAEGLFEYGLEFNISESDRQDLVALLNDVQIKMRQNILFAEGQFTNETTVNFFEAT